VTDQTDWLQLAKDVFTSSTTYMDANHRKVFERNIALHKSVHPDGSKYKSQAYKNRSRLFRPKTRSVVRKNEAAASAAFFANVDVVNCEPENDADPQQVASAALMNEVINYRLTKTVPWFVTVMGAVQEAQVIGIVGSYQYWKYKEEPGEKFTHEGEEYEAPPTVLEDQPCIELMPVENYRFDPAADWTDPVGTSPYFVRIVPMYVDDVRQKMRETDSKTGQAKWKKLTDQEIRSAMAEYDTTRQARESPKQDPLTERDDSLKDFEMVFCHENFIKRGGKEHVYWTLGTEHLLTDPALLKEVYHTGERPFVIGCAVLEAHKAVPDSLVGIGSDLQKEANDVTNQRRDNVSLVLNKRYFVKRGAQVDTESLLRNVAGGVTLVNDTEHDIREVEFNDVTGSAYQEQDRVNLDFDELVGNFSQGSVQTNRKMNETVGGMELAAGGASAMTEYLLRTVVETWMEKVLNQLVKLEKTYETDQVILAVAGAKAQIARFGMEPSDQMLEQPMTIRVSMGMGATDPQKKLGRFLGALKAGGEAMQLLPNANPEMVWNEIFGLAGYKGGSRFMQPSAPNAALMQQNQEMHQALQEAQQKAAQAEVVATQAKMQAIKAQMDAAHIKAQADAAVRQAQMDKGVMQAKGEIERAHGQFRETVLKNKPAETMPVDIKPALDKMRVEVDKQILDKDKANAILQIQLAEKTAELQLVKADHSVQMKSQAVDHTLEKDKVERQAGEKVSKAETTAHDAKQDAKHKEPAKDNSAEVVKHVKELKEIVTAPKELVRDESGKATHVKQGDKLTPIKRDKDGRIVGL